MMTSSNVTVEGRGLGKTFGPIRAVDGVDLDLARGRIYGLLGPNGSGKTTLIRLLTGLARPTAGRVTVLGTAMPDRAILARIGYMTQADGVYGELSVLENIRFYGAMYGIRDTARLREALAVVELADREATPAEELSGGLRRRLSLACALAHRPIAEGFRRDRRSLALVFIVPIVVLALLGWVIRGQSALTTRLGVVGGPGPLAAGVATAISRAAASWPGPSPDPDPRARRG
ncbi:MAG: ABC transporter ATP-binding protein [Chloroflexota bacterium]|nr:MAG: ABC transporter ATP-binding protein [Chloroflexota bacterium]